jgi:hypothetical protein
LFVVCPSRLFLPSSINLRPLPEGGGRKFYDGLLSRINSSPRLWRGLNYILDGTRNRPVSLFRNHGETLDGKELGVEAQRLHILVGQRCDSRKKKEVRAVASATVGR